jgi:hypothetical protein
VQEQRHNQNGPAVLPKEPKHLWIELCKQGVPVVNAAALRGSGMRPPPRLPPAQACPEFAQFDTMKLPANAAI